MSQRPNLLLICTDQWRGDCLSSTGHPVVHTPYLDQLAQRGTRFDAAYSATPVCIPARAGLMAGQSHKRHGRTAYQDGVYWNYPITMAGELSKAGYQTHCVGKMHAHPERHRLGFQSIDLHDGFLPAARQRHDSATQYDDYLCWLRDQTGNQREDYFDHGVHCNSFLGRPWDKEERLHPTNWVTHKSIEFLERRDPTTPFFLMMSFHRPHPPYDPPQAYFDMYMDMEFPEPVMGDWTDRFEHLRQDAMPDAYAGKNRDDVMRRSRAGYYGLITHIDHQINRFYFSMIEHGVANETWIIFTSDHGELLGDHGLYRKGVPFEGSARIPFLIIPPRNQWSSQRQTDALAELRDVAPTLLDLAGVEIPESMDGESLVPITESRKAKVRDHLHGECNFGGSAYHFIVKDKWKYCRSIQGGWDLLFDLNCDPHEERDLSTEAKHRPRLEAMQQLLKDELRDRPEDFLTQEDDFKTEVNTAPCMPFVYEAHAAWEASQ